METNQLELDAVYNLYSCGVSLTVLVSSCDLFDTSPYAVDGSHVKLGRCAGRRCRLTVM